MEQDSFGNKDTCVEVTEITEKFPGTVALKDISFKIKKGEIFCLLGPNGAGKTTLVRLLTGQIKPTTGQVQVLGHNPYAERDLVTSHIGLVPQEIALYDELTGRENLTFHAALFGLPQDETSRRIDNMLAVAGLTDRQSDRVRIYSGGMKRRLQLARGMLHDPEILFLDEPTLGVDVQSRSAIHEYIKELPHKGKTVVLTTNYMEEAQKLADRVIILDTRVVAGPDTIEGITLSAISETMLVFTVKKEHLQEAFKDEFIKQMIGGEIIKEESVGDDMKFRVKISNTQVESILGSLLLYCRTHEISIQGLTVATPTIEDAFLNLTGKQLRD